MMASHGCGPTRPLPGSSGPNPAKGVGAVALGTTFPILGSEFDLFRFTTWGLHRLSFHLAATAAVWSGQGYSCRFAAARCPARGGVVAA